MPQVITSRKRDRGIESPPGLIRGVEGFGQLLLGLLHIGTSTQHPQRDPDRELFRGAPSVECSPFDRVRRPAQQAAKLVFRLADLSVDLHQVVADTVIVGFGLGKRSGVVTPGLHQAARHLNVLTPAPFGLIVDVPLGIERQQRVVGRGHRGDELRLHGPGVGFAGKQCGKFSAFGVAQRPEKVEFPGGVHRELDLPRTVMDGACREIDRRQVGQSRRTQHGLGLLHFEACRRQIDVVAQCRVDQCRKVRIAEELLPPQVSRRKAVRLIDRPEGVVRDLVLRGPEGPVDAAPGQEKQREQKEHPSADLINLGYAHGCCFFLMMMNPNRSWRRCMTIKSGGTKNSRAIVPTSIPPTTPAPSVRLPLALAPLA